MPVRAAQAASRQFAPQLGHGNKIGPDVMSTQGRVAMDADAYDRAWRIERRAGTVQARLPVGIVRTASASVPLGLP